MQRLFEPYVFSDALRYEGHFLRYSNPETLAGNTDEKSVETTTDDLMVGGILGAALLSVLLVDTPEGDRRGIAIDSEAEQDAWFERYEREMRCEEWALWHTEVLLLHEAYLSFSLGATGLNDICPNIRLLDLAFKLTSRYMQRLTREQVGSHIYDFVPWCRPFGAWLLEAAANETLRSRLLQIDWTDPAQVAFAAEDTSDEDDDAPVTYTWFFDDLTATQVLTAYYDRLMSDLQQEAQRLPGSKRNLVRLKAQALADETNPDLLPMVLTSLSPDDRQSFDRWMDEWTGFITRRLKPERPILFWVKAVDEELQDRLTDFIRIQERQPKYYKCLAAAVYALRQLGYVRRGCRMPDILRWLSGHLLNDYTEKNRAMQFRRAWNELSRYSPVVHDFVNGLRSYGVTRLQEPNE